MRSVICVNRALLFVSHITERSCTCDAGWIGAQCETLNIQPTKPSLAALRAYPPANGTASWGGNSVYDPQAKMWHLFVSPVSNHCGMDCWNTQQYIQHAVSKYVAGPYANDVVDGGIVLSLMSTCTVMWPSADTGFLGRY